MAELSTVLQKIDEETGVAWLTFNRPEKKNAMSQKFMAELIKALKDIAENDKIKCVVTMGSGDSYSSGLDLYDLRESWKRKRRLGSGRFDLRDRPALARHAADHGGGGARLVSGRRSGVD